MELAGSQNWVDRDPQILIDSGLLLYNVLLMGKMSFNILLYLGRQ